jgi:hypothetical protein
MACDRSEEQSAVVGTGFGVDGLAPVITFFGCTKGMSASGT